jgi:polar amino acid transport system permease protein
MRYVFQFGVVLDHKDALIVGVLATLRLSLLAMVFGLAIAIGCAFLRRGGPWPLAFVIAAYVEIIRNTPLLVQLFIIYFSLPALGIRFEAEQAALLGLSLNLGGYATEIIRAGLDAIPKGQIEAGRALGLTRLQIFRLIMLFPALRIVYPALASQFIILLLGSSIVSAISATELTAITNTLQSTTFRAFEFYFVATAIYLALAVVVRLALDGIRWAAFERGRAW